MVLIVAKCIVNKVAPEFIALATSVLIVAKCIVNMIENRTVGVFLSVLIVAKCIVNYSLKLEILEPDRY